MDTGAFKKHINLQDLLKIFVSKFIIILALSVFIVGVVFCVMYITFVPEYKSTAVIYVLKQVDNNSTNISANDNSADYRTNSDFSLALNVVNDCTYILKSHTVLDSVLADKKVKDANLNITFNELAENISTSNPEYTRVLEVTVTADTPEHAKLLVDTVCRVGSEQIEDVMGLQQMNKLDEGTTSSVPSNSLRFKYFAIMFAGCFVGIYIIFVVIYSFDDSIKTNEQIETQLGLTVLGDIPNFNGEYANKPNHKKYYTGYRKAAK